MNIFFHMNLPNPYKVSLLQLGQSVGLLSTLASVQLFKLMQMQKIQFVIKMFIFLILISLASLFVIWNSKHKWVAILFRYLDYLQGEDSPSLLLAKPNGLQHT
jgi:hypothetical protein